MQTIITNFEKRFRIRVLTPEYAILLHLFGCEQETSKRLLGVCGYSNTQHHVALRSLEGRELIVQGVDPRDLRLKLYSLSANCRAELHHMYAATPGWINGKLSGNSVTGIMPRFTRELRHRMGVNHTSCAYEILLFLYDMPNLVVYELLSHSNYSGTTFYAALSQLRNDGFLTTCPDVNDARRLRCNLAPEVADFMDEQHVLILQWLQASSGA